MYHTFKSTALAVIIFTFPSTEALCQWSIISSVQFSSDQNPPTITAAAAAAAAKSLQSCLTLCHPVDSSPPGSAIPGILQARMLEWVAISFSNAWKWKVKVKSLSRVWIFTIPWTAAHQAPLSVGFSRQEYWSGVPLPSPAMVIELYEYTKRHWNGHLWMGELFGMQMIPQ